MWCAITFRTQTMLAMANPFKLQSLLDLTSVMGNQYGLDLSWEKYVVMAINDPGVIHDPSMQQLKKVQQARDLGSLLHYQAESKLEITRRLGEARELLKV